MLRFLTAGVSCALLLACAQVIPDVTVDATLPQVLQAPEGQALIIFYEAKDVLNHRVNVMDMSGRYVTSVATGTFVALSVPPGQHDFVVFVGPKDVRPLRASLSAGQVAPIEISARAGFWALNIDVNAHGSTSALKGLQATVPADVQRAEAVLHDSWNVSELLELATERYSRMPDSERALCTITPSP